ncbi:FAD-dependent oxidoreductase [Streptomyces sp. NPDC079020]|uniref:FAD-dependent oxidoreductase n=1 Tax=Streptomyces sp. NPDC079020 TaxID=3365722 RepID=UPI0037D14728
MQWPGTELQRSEWFLQQLPLALHRRFAAAGGTTFLGHRLTRLDRVNSAIDGIDGPYYRLRFARAEPAAPREVLARTVLLALPHHAVELLKPDIVRGRSSRPPSLLAATRPVPAVKLFLSYPRPWWHRTGVSRGRSTTDLPLRQLWYWATPPGPGETPGGVLAVYASGSAAAHWTALADGPLYTDREFGPAPGSRERTEPGPASRLQTEQAHAMLLRVHGVVAAPRPLASRWQHWSVEHHGGAWPVWRPGHDPEQAIPAMREPLPGEAVFCVSDSTTLRPGSVEGVLASAEHLLQGPLGRPRPAWLRTHASPGWDVT